jgi:ribose transport system substrate-binding protein
MGKKGKVMTLTNPGQTNHDIRTDTFVKVIQAEFPDIQVVAQEVSKQDPDASYTAVMTVAQKHPDLGGVFMPEANSGMGAARAAVELNNGLRVLCCDVNATILDMIKTGEIWGAINPNQGNQGYMGMLMLFLACHPEYTSFMSSDEDKGLSAIQIPFLDNSLNIVQADTADYYYVDKYATKLGYASVEDMLSPYIPE